eukprot:COSAG04_NODE_10263_length_791_cov_1.140173_1_plen_43_part_10
MSSAAGWCTKGALAKTADGRLGVVDQVALGVVDQVTLRLAGGG